MVQSNAFSSHSPRPVTFGHLARAIVKEALEFAVQALLDRYFELLPGYQGVPLASLKFQRVLFGGFPCYSSSPLQPQFDRILQVTSQALSLLHTMCPSWLRLDVRCVDE
jgi:hypothetical protein